MTVSAVVISPKLAVLDHVRVNWDPARVKRPPRASDTVEGYKAVSGVTPVFRTGWYQETLNQPHITAVDYDETPIGGGITGYYAIRGDGTGPTQHRIGAVQFGCWAHRDMTNLHGMNPKTLTELAAREIIRILIDAAQGITHSVTYDTGVDETKADLTRLDWISVATIRDMPPDEERAPTLFHSLATARYGYFT